ncbi:hypothetical protein C8R44DRAFT_868215 [Mycena epipterygia]|nr:hypothetical protein C8R44DRAFT_868215 [Mycena epipterygia]
MQLSTSFIALALVSLCAAVPREAVAIAAAHYIQGLLVTGEHNQCCQNNLGGSFCTTMYRTGTACVGICSTGAFSIPGCDTSSALSSSTPSNR